MKVPFQNLHSQYLSIKKDIDAGIANVINNSSFVRGPHVQEFENNFSLLFDSKYCISCGNGTDSLFIAIKSLGAKKGDEILVPAHSWISTSEVVSLAGCKVVFVDTEKDTFNISIDDLKNKITENTVGIIPVHLFGQAAKIDQIMDIAKSNNLWVIEDCAQAHLAERNGKKVGTYGTFGSFSFYPGKNLGAMGDGGCLITDCEDSAVKAQMFARHGGLKKGEHKIEGINSRLDGMQAAILNVKLGHIQNWTKKRIEIANLYNDRLKEISNIKLPFLDNSSSHVYHLYVVSLIDGSRDELKKYLKEQGIDTIINYPISLPYLECYRHLNHQKEDFPNAYANHSQILSLPIFPEMSLKEQDYVIEKIKSFYKD
jgi:dTDP-4-amino-4,6-dideoxygalactose transaminase